MINRPIEAVCFDMDGLLLDTESFGVKTLAAAVAEQGCRLSPEQEEWFHSRSLTEINEQLESWFPGRIDKPLFAERWKVITFEYMDRVGAPRKPGADEALTAVRAAGYKTALCTSNVGYVVRHHLAQAGWLPHFDLIVSAEMLAKPKPDPEVYLTAARMLGVDPARCVGVEDSYTGLQAVRDAGMVSIMVPDRKPYCPAIADRVDLVLNSLLELPEALENIQNNRK